jgi:L-ascorbate metabolism protein UlaG (beta-lactamase superfamily)
MGDTISCTYVGHATTFIDMGGELVMTDPVFSDRVGLQGRKNPLPMAPLDIPSPSCVLISHAHLDHLDISSFKFIPCHVPIVVPEGVGDIVSKYLPNPAIELSHFATHSMPSGLEITAVPAKHHSFRHLPFWSSEANAYIIRKEGAEKRVLFVGDSAYGEHFSKARELGPIDLAILPIGCYEPSWFMKSRHMTPKEALQAFEDLGAKVMLPMHHGTFKLSFEPIDQPLQLLRQELEARPDLKSRVHPLSPGESLRI